MYAFLMPDKYTNYCNFSFILKINFTRKGRRKRLATSSSPATVIQGGYKKSDTGVNIF